MTITTAESNTAECDLRRESAIVGKYRQIGQIKAARNRVYAAAMALNNAA